MACSSNEHSRSGQELQSQNEDENSSMPYSNLLLNELEHLGKQLETEGIGSLIHTNGACEQAILYTGVPQQSHLTVLTPDVIIIEKSQFLKSLCESFENAKCFTVQWICSKNGIGRLSAACCRHAIMRDECDGEKLINHMENEKSKGRVDHLSYGFTSNNVLSYVTWSFEGSKEIAQKYGDIVFWDSTHDMIPYTYKLSSFTVVDCEGNKRSKHITQKSNL